MSWRKEIQRLKWISKHLDHLTPASICWLRDYLAMEYDKKGNSRHSADAGGSHPDE